MKAFRAATAWLVVIGLSVTANADTFDVDDADVGLDLARLSALEQARGNGGAEGDTNPILAGWDKKNGFHIRDEADNFRLRVGGRLQARYTYEGLDGADVSTFELERARIGVRGHFFTPRLQYKLEMDVHTDAGVAGMTDGFLYFKGLLGESDKLLNIGAGQFKPRFMRQQKTSSAKQQFVDRSLTTELFNIDRNVGVWLDGEQGIFQYHLALTNGFNTDNANPRTTVDHSPAIVVGFDLNLLRNGDANQKMEEGDFRHSEDPVFVVGGAFATDTNNGSGGGAGRNTFKVYTAQIDAVFKYLGASVQSEYVMRWWDNTGALYPTGAGTLFSHGFYVQGGYFFVPKRWELAARASFVWNDDPVLNGEGVEVGPALNWYISENHNLKLTLDSVWVDIDGNIQPATENINRTSARLLRSSSTGLTAGDQGVITRLQAQIVF